MTTGLLRGNLVIRCYHLYRGSLRVSKLKLPEPAEINKSNMASAFDELFAYGWAT